MIVFRTIGSYSSCMYQPLENSLRFSWWTRSMLRPSWSAVNGFLQAGASGAPDRATLATAVSVASSAACGAGSGRFGCAAGCGSGDVSVAQLQTPAARPLVPSAWIARITWRRSPSAGLRAYSEPTSARSQATTSSASRCVGVRPCSRAQSLTRCGRPGSALRRAGPMPESINPRRLCERLGGTCRRIVAEEFLQQSSGAVHELRLILLRTPPAPLASAALCTLLRHRLAGALAV